MPRTSFHAWLIAGLAALPCVAGALAAEQMPAPPSPTPSQRKIDFARDVRPILAQRCFACHGGGQQQGGLRLETAADLLLGGDSGAVVRPGKSADSLLIRYVAGLEPGKVMPPAGERLTAAQIGTLRAWIDQGAAAEGGKDEGGRRTSTHWAFIPPKRPALPKVRDAGWVRNPVDRFVLARLEREGLKPSPEADRRTLIRRLSFDLLGLPPTPEEVEAFVSDARPDAYEKLADRLLASPHFGERWGRHWLDLARYADSDGYEKDLPRPYAYLYRDWVIQALNRDMPFDQFTVEQLAGDLLPNATLEQKIATGFHRNTLKNREGGIDPEEDRVKVTVDRTNTTGTVWLGLTVGCAECHTHKYDPITQREYYQLYAFFNSAQEVDLPAAKPEEQEEYRAAKERWEREHAPLAAALEPYERNAPARVRQWEEQAGQAMQKLPAPVAAVLEVPGERRTAAQQKTLLEHVRSLDAEWARHHRAVAAHARKAPAPPAVKALTLAENPSPPATRIHVRGDFLRKGDAVEAATLAVLPGLSGGAQKPTRLDLARWLVSPDNPLTARVTVNRIWMQLFGRGLVSTTNDFGTRGERPSHPELLDWLAAAFGRAPVRGSEFGVPSSVGSNTERRTRDTEPSGPKAEPGTQNSELKLGWSLKRTIRLLVTSAAYRQASASRAELEARDPKNILLARQSRFRPEAEIVRDLYLAAGGLLHREVGGPSIRPPLPADIAALGYAGSVKWSATTGPERYKRGMYIFFQRTVPYPQLLTFDAPDANVTCSRRERSNTPLQALTLLNDPVFFEAAQALARRIVREAPAPLAERLRFAVRASLLREPTPTERARLLRLFWEAYDAYRAQPEEARKTAGADAPSEASAAETAAWVVVARTLMNLDEFYTRE